MKKKRKDRPQHAGRPLGGPRQTGHVLEQAAEHYIEYVALTQHTVRPEVMAHVRKSIDKNRKLLHLLAK